MAIEGTPRTGFEAQSSQTDAVKPLIFWESPHPLSIVRVKYFAKHPPPRTPQDLTTHACINLRLPSHGLYAWEFEKNGRDLRVRVEGQLVFNTSALILNAAVAGFGLAYLTEQQVQRHLDSGDLVRVLATWCPPFTGYHLYYPSRRQPTPAFALLVDALRYRATPEQTQRRRSA